MLRLRFSQRALRFNFPARTSRGALAEHVAWYLHLTHHDAPAVTGLGEAAPLAGLSPDYGPEFPAAIAQLCARFNAGALATFAAADAPAFVGPGRWRPRAA
jgi:O-succinylbenzoate synthase